VGDGDEAGVRTGTVSPESKEFLASLFAYLRENLDEKEPRAAEERAIFDALLDGLDRGVFSDAKKLRTYIAELARSTDKANEYERVSLEHKALGELSDALAEQP